MNCAVHPERSASKNCSHCKKPFCEECLSRSVDGNACETCAVGSVRKSGGGIPGWVWVLGVAGVVGIGACILVSIIAAIAIPNLIEARKVGNETAAIGALRTISSVQAQFREGDRDEDGFLDYATSLAELRNVGLIDSVLGSGIKAGYSFSLSGSTYEWKAMATPVSASTATRNYIICTDGVVRFAGRGTADCNSAAIE